MRGWRSKRSREWFHMKHLVKAMKSNSNVTLASDEKLRAAFELLCSSLGVVSFRVRAEDDLIDEYQVKEKDDADGPSQAG